ncbi:MAG: phosphatase PAP2 family protein [Gammaproteobacteria bacterium]|nr:phosphatase PAP2 family protein [Gammaproteobacteria bacterium]
MYSSLTNAELLAEVVAANAFPLFISTLLGALALALALAWSWRVARPAGDPTPQRILAVGMSCMLPAGLLFLSLAGALSHRGALVTFDEALAAALQATQPAETLRAAALVTHFGDTATLTGLCVALAALLLVRGHHLLAAGWIAAVAGNSLLNVTLKSMFERVRPIHEHGYTIETSWSFPSGHASGTVVAYGMAAYVLMRLLPARWHLPLLLLAVTIAMSTAASRVVLQVHFASDVLAGISSGTLWLSLCVMSQELLRRRPDGAPRPDPFPLDGDTQ